MEEDILERSSGMKSIASKRIQLQFEESEEMVAETIQSRL